MRLPTLRTRFRVGHGENRGEGRCRGWAEGGAGEESRWVKLFMRRSGPKMKVFALIHS